MFYLFLLGVAAAGAAIYLLLVVGLFPGLKEERFGVLEPLPPNLGQWEPDVESEAGRAAAAAGQRREQRFVFEAGGLMGAGKLLRQARLRETTSNQIVRVLPDEVIKRRRVRPPAS